MGYIILDHSASDPIVQRKFGRVKEYDTVLCKHCEAIIYQPLLSSGPGLIIKEQEEGAICQSCGDICMTCAEHMFNVGYCEKGSLDFRRKIDAAFSRIALFKSVSDNNQRS